MSSTFSQVQPGNKLKYAWGVQLLEMDLAALDLGNKNDVWPRDVPPPSGVLLCYDAQQSESLQGFERTMRE